MYRKQEQNDPNKKLIFREDVIYAKKTKEGNWNLMFTTLDPTETYKVRKIATVSKRPSKAYIEDVKRNYFKGEEIVKYILDKNKIKDIITDYGFKIIDKESPFKPREFGAKKRKVDEISDDEVSDSDEKDKDTKSIKTSSGSDTEEEETETPVENTKKSLDIIESINTKLEENSILLKELSVNVRILANFVNPTASTAVDQTGSQQ